MTLLSAGSSARTPLVHSLATPQSLNRYSYVLNNPLRYVAPTGLLTDEEIAETFGEETLEFLKSAECNTGWYKVLRATEWGDVIRIEGEFADGSGYAYFELIERVGLECYYAVIGGEYRNEMIGLTNLGMIAAATTVNIDKSDEKYEVELYAAESDIFGNTNLVKQKDKWTFERSWWARNSNIVGVAFETWLGLTFICGGLVAGISIATAALFLIPVALAVAVPPMDFGYGLTRKGINDVSPGQYEWLPYAPSEYGVLY